MKIKGKTIVVTGGGSGLGRELSLQLSQAGATIASVDINAKGLEETKQKAANPDNIKAFVCDITNKEAVAELAVRVAEACTHVDGLINNAGIIQPFVNVADMDDALIDRLFAINFFGALNMYRAFIPYIRQSHEGLLVNVASLGCFVPVSGQSMYGATKAALKQLTDGLRAELSEANIHVMIIIPGAMATPIRQNSGMEALDLDKQKGNGTQSPAAAASQIIKGIYQDRQEMYIGKDSRLMHNLFRFIPLQAGKWMNAFIRHQHKVMESRK